MYFLLQLVLDILASWARLFLALFLSITFSIVVGITAAKSERAESVILPVLDILQTLPIIAFFPVVIYLIVSFIPSYVGINLAVIFLIFTSMSWNISFGVYEAVKAIPSELRELAEIGHLSGFQVVKDIYIPAAMPRIAYQSLVSWSVGLFYLVTSEIFSTGSRNFAVQYGIGSEIARLVLSGDLGMYIVALLFFIAALLLTRILFLQPFSMYAERFSFADEQRPAKRSSVLTFYAKIGGFLGSAIPRVNLGFRRGRPAHIQDYGTRREGKQRRGIASLLFATLLVMGFVATTILFNAFAYLPALITALIFSFIRVWGMYILCVAITIPLGIKIAKSERVYEPAIAALQTVAAIPATILLPAIVAVLYLLPFGNELTALAVIFLAMVWYLLFSVVSGMRTVPAQFKELVGIFRVRWTHAWREIYIPAILPSFVTGSITAIGGAWNALIVAEYFSIETSAGGSMVLTQVGSGIGKLLDIAAFQGNLLLMGLALATMVIMVVFINRLVWQRLYKKVTLRYRIEV